MIATRPVWYFDDHNAVSHESVTVGEALHGRAPDAWRVFFIEPDGRLVLLFDTPCSSLPAEWNR